MGLVVLGRHLALGETIGGSDGEGDCKVYDWAFVQQASYCLVLSFTIGRVGLNIPCRHCAPKKRQK